MKTPAFLLAKIMCDKNTSEWLSELQPKTLVRGPKYHSVSILGLTFHNKYTDVFLMGSVFDLYICNLKISIMNDFLLKNV
jgi:hypothetical protein